MYIYLLYIQVERYGLRKRSYTRKIRSFTTIFRRITVVYLRNRIRRKTEIVYGRLRPCLFDLGTDEFAAVKMIDTKQLSMTLKRKEY
jgi:hypothetical protein